jgi:PASTA domain
MAARLALLAPRLITLVVIWLLAAASFTLAAGGGETTQPATVAPPARQAPEALVVPDVRGQVYVFAKGILQDAGFSWRVDGAVDGYAANTVVSQNPAPGVRVVDNGAPTVALRLERNGKYEERGVPENSSPYAGSKVVLVSDWRAGQESKPAPAKATAKPKPKPKPAKPKPARAPQQKKQKGPRQPDFVVPGAPREPADELPLPARARLLSRDVAAAAKPTPRFVDHWLYQHSWIVTGARFGWKNGDDALRILIQVDRTVQARFGFGARSEQVARRALAFVESRTG